MVEYIPENLRRDKELYEFFDALFPGQVVRAEVLLNASELTSLIQEREHNIIQYENVFAKHYHRRAVYSRNMQMQGRRNVGILQYMFCTCCGLPPREPFEPQISLGRDWKKCCRRKKVKALLYYLSEIKQLNQLIDEEHKRILREKMRADRQGTPQKFDVSNLRAGAMKLMSGIKSDLNCDTGFVQFKTLTAKQSAIQCNITGTADFLVTSPAPDARDIIWRNAIVERGTILMKQLQLDGLLLTGTLFWAGVITAINSISNLSALSNILPEWLIPSPDSFLGGLIQGWLPVLLLETIMMVLIYALDLVAKQYIRFKTHSEIDTFVYKWHFAYRLVNMLIIIISGSLLQLVQSAKADPQEVLQSLAKGISTQSQFFLNNVIVAIGTETLWELAQMPTMIAYFVMHKFITVEAKSKRYLEKLEEASKFEWGEDVPSSLFVFMISVVYTAQVPIILGVCALYFYVSFKVHVHQSLFVYAQPYEGGGKLMYLLNRTILTTLYVGILIFSTSLALKEMPVASPMFLFCMFAVTVYVDMKIQKTFVSPSETLALIKVC